MFKKITFLFLLVVSHIGFASAQCVVEMVVSSTNVSCNGFGDGAIVVQTNPAFGQCTAIAEGPGGVSFTASSDASGSIGFSNLGPGLWDILVSRSNGPGQVCYGSDQVQITQPSVLTVGLNTGVVCAQDSRALTLAPTIGGGMPGFSFHWSSGQTTRPIMVTSSGLYSLTVTDLNGCQAVASTTVGVLPLPNIALQANATSCNGFCDGSVGTSISGGLPSFSYLWNNGATTQNLSNVCAGGYSLTVTDAEGCKFKQNAIVPEGNQCLRTFTGTVISDVLCDRVINSDDPKLSGVMVTLTKPDGATLTTQTNALGQYSFSFVYNGAGNNFSIAVSHPSYVFVNTPTTNVVVSQGGGFSQ